MSLLKKLSQFKFRHALDVACVAILYFFTLKYLMESAVFNIKAPFLDDFNYAWHWLLLLPALRFLICPLVKFFYNNANDNAIFLHVDRNVVTLKFLNGHYKTLVCVGNYSSDEAIVSNADELVITVAKVVNEAVTKMKLIGGRPYVLFTTASLVTRSEVEAITKALYDVGVLEARSMPVGSKLEDAKLYVRNHPVRSSFVNWVAN